MEMTNNWVDFEHYEGNSSDLVAYEEITGNFIFDVKLSDNFRRKARFVAAPKKRIDIISKIISK